MKRRQAPTLSGAFGDAVHLIIQDYRHFLAALGCAPCDDAKAFTARHAAARAALAHLEQLLKIAGGQAGDAQAADGAALIDEAKGILGLAPPDEEEESADDRSPDG